MFGTVWTEPPKARITLRLTNACKRPCPPRWPTAWAMVHWGWRLGWRKQKRHCVVSTQIRLIIFFAAKVGEALSAKTRLGADCGPDHELLITKFRLKWKKIGKTTRPFRYDLNQISYDYAMEVKNTFKALDLIECLWNYGRKFVTLYRRQWSRPSPKKRNAKRQNGCLRRPYK